MWGKNCSWKVNGTQISNQLSRHETVNGDFFGLAIDVQGKVLVEMAENLEGTIVGVCKWRLVTVTPHIHAGGRMEIRREINGMTAMPSHRNKLEVLH